LHRWLATGQKHRSHAIRLDTVCALLITQDDELLIYMENHRFIKVTQTRRK